MTDQAGVHAPEPEPDLEPTSELSSEDAKLVTLARGARGRISAPEGAALRDETGRTYASATVSLPTLQLSAVQACVAQAVAAGARGVEAVAVVKAVSELDASGMAALRDLGQAGVPVFIATDHSDSIIKTVT
ncbi:MAG TPA: cytidine deaminase [Actinomycetes bacterium]|nr:cytidine deaminase [Actinomycetes bacterium]